MLLDDIPAEDVGRAPVLLPLLGLVNEPRKIVKKICTCIFIQIKDKEKNIFLLDKRYTLHINSLCIKYH